ncbi:MAG TPA: hypothetical protein VIT67_01765 [Povalibacter sp.]
MQSSTASMPAAPSQHSRLRFELILGSALLGVGLFALPALIFVVGTSLLGPYGSGSGAGIGTFYADFFGDLATGSIRAWALALGPLIVVGLIRLLFLRRPTDAETVSDDDTDATPQPRRPVTQDSRRIEPRVNLD